ncbi:MAG: ComEC/Rec2 family competence protein [Cryobacterium sp.]
MPLDLRLVLPAVAAWAAAGILIGFPDLAPHGSAAFWALAVLAALLLFRPALRRRRGRARRVGRTEPGHPAGTALLAGLMVCCAAAGMVAAVVAVHAPARLPEPVRTAAERHSTITGLFTVTSTPVPAPLFAAAAAYSQRVRFRATLTELGTADSGTSAARPASALQVPVVVFADLAEPRGLQIGSAVSLTGALRPTDTGDAAAALVFGQGPVQLVGAPPRWLTHAAQLRSTFGSAATALPGDGGDLLAGLAIGDTGFVSDQLDTAMKTSSLSHLTAVSGANCAIIIGAIMILGARLRLRRGWRIALSLLALLGFVVLVTPEPSVLRSSVMATVTLLSLGLGRPGRGLPTLALSVLVLLSVDPWLARSYGFALSVLATLGLLVFAGPLIRVLSRAMPVGIAALIAIPLAAQLACQPVLVMLSPSLPLYGVPANLLAGPAAPVATVLGLVACLALPLAPWLGTVALWLAWLPSAWIAAVAQTTATLPASTLPWPGGPLGVLGLAALSGGVLILALTAGRTPARSAWRLVTTGLVLVAVAAYAGSVLGSGIGRAARFPADWQVAACDVGQGDAVVVRDRDERGVNRYALIDAGPDPALLTRCLNTLRIDRITLLVLTHYDLDHVGGLAAVIGRVDDALVGVAENGRDTALHDDLAGGGARLTEAYRGDTGTMGGLTWRVSWPERAATRMQTGNDGSVTIGFDGRGLSSLFLGDLGEDSQNALRAAGRLGPVDVVKVAHHGSADQSPDLYADLHARIGLISVGADNGYGHPAPTLLRILQDAGTHALRTDQQGLTVLAAAPDGSVTVWSERPTEPGARPVSAPATAIVGALTPDQARSCAATQLDWGTSSQAAGCPASSG